MPGFATHYIFGRETYRKLKCNPQKRNIYHNRAAYALGLQGPDLFFFYLPSYALYKSNLGSIAHTQETGAFFLGLIESCCRITNSTDRSIAEAYLTGFLGHYLLDTACHPYVYAATHYSGPKKDYFWRHAYLETDIDTALLDLKLHRKPCQFHAASTIALTRRQKKVVARLLYDAYHYAFPTLRIRKSTMHAGIFSIRLGMWMLHDDSGQKKVLFRFAEKHFLGYPLFSPLIPSDTLFFRTDPFNLRHAVWTNPWNSSLTSQASFFELYDAAQERYLIQMEKLDALLHTAQDTPLQRKLLHNFMKDYQNLSFHSGLDVSIPS